jgi:hypothetical protein
MLEAHTETPVNESVHELLQQIVDLEFPQPGVMAFFLHKQSLVSSLQQIVGVAFLHHVAIVAFHLHHAAIVAFLHNHVVVAFLQHSEACALQHDVADEFLQHVAKMTDVG